MSASLNIDLSVNSAAFEDGFRKATQSVQDFGRQSGTALTTATQAISLLESALGTAGGTFGRVAAIVAEFTTGPIGMMTAAVSALTLVLQNWSTVQETLTAPLDATKRSADALATSIANTAEAYKLLARLREEGDPELRARRGAEASEAEITKRQQELRAENARLQALFESADYAETYRQYNEALAGGGGFDFDRATAGVRRRVQEIQTGTQTIAQNLRTIEELQKRLDDIRDPPLGPPPDAPPLPAARAPRAAGAARVAAEAPDTSFERAVQRWQSVQAAIDPAASSLARYTQQMDITTEAFVRGISTQEQFENATARLGEQYRKTTETAAAGTKEWQRGIDGIAKSISGDFAAAMVSGEMSVSKFITSIAGQIAQLVIYLAMVKPIVQGVFGPSGLGIISGPAPAAAGAVSYGGPRAGGGPVWPGAAFLVGESGPEMFVPPSGGTIVPGGAGVTVNVYNQAADTTVETRERQGPSGREIELFITRTVDANLAAGRHDRAMRANFGLRRATTT